MGNIPLEPERVQQIPAQTPQPPNPLNTFSYEVQKNTPAGNYMGKQDYMTQKNYELAVQSPDGGPGILKGSTLFEQEQKMQQKQYDSDQEQRERMKKF